MTLRSQNPHKANASPFSIMANFYFNLMQVIGTNLPSDNAADPALRAGSHVETDKFTDFRRENAAVRSRINESQVASRLLVCRIANDNRYNRPFGATRKSLIGKLHGLR